jgi:solute carrier family 25 folate transporter 32
MSPFSRGSDSTSSSSTSTSSSPIIAAIKSRRSNSNSEGPSASFLETLLAHASEDSIRAASGGIAGFASGVVTCPLDVIKTKLQAQGGFRIIGRDSATGRVTEYRGVLGTARVIWHEEGVRGMYRGLGPTVVGYLPTWAVYFAVYEKTKRAYGKWFGKSNRGERL